MTQEQIDALLATRFDDPDIVALCEALITERNNRDALVDAGIEGDRIDKLTLQKDHEKTDQLRVRVTELEAEIASLKGL
jgi:hypothetical protein